MYRDLTKRKECQKRYAKTPAAKAARSAWRRTKAGRAHRLRATMARYRRHKAWVDAYKLKKGCVECDYRMWPEALDFDHKNPKKKSFSISQKLYWSIERLRAEIVKCVVRCANC